MAAYFIDIDGVLLRHGSMKPNPGAIEHINYLIKQKHQVYLTTKRDSKPYSLNIKMTKKILHRLGANYTDIIEGASSPRFIINDEGAYGINHLKDEPLRFLEAQIIRENSVVKKIHDAIAIMAWVTMKYINGNDADDYVQTLIIAQSLIKHQGFNHRDLVKRYRKKTKYLFKNKALHNFNPGGVSKRYRGQLYKLNKSKNPLYTARTGVTTGAAMKILPIVAFYLLDYEALIQNTDNIVKVTHYTIEARLSAILVALRYRQVLLNTHNTTDDLLREFKRAIQILGFGSQSRFFLQQVIRAKKITDKIDNPEHLLIELAREVGLDYLAWSTPISATFWSFKADTSCYGLFNPEGEGKIKLKKYTIDTKTLKKSWWKRYERHLVYIGQFKSFYHNHKYHWKKKIDTDTFFSIAFSIIAAEKGLGKIEKEVGLAIKEFGDNLPKIAHALVYKKRYGSFISVKQRSKLFKHFIKKLFITPYNNIHLNLGIKTFFRNKLRAAPTQRSNVGNVR